MGFLDKLGAGGIVSGVGGLAQLGFGIADKIKGKKKLKEAESFWKQNQSVIPEAAKASVSNAERQASGVRMPAEDMRRAQMGEATSGAVGAAQQAASSGSDVLSVLGNVYGQQQSGEQDLAIAGADRYDRNQSALRGELGRMAGWEQEKWQYNSLMPYQQMLGQAEALSSRGSQGIGMGFGALGQTGANYSQVQGAQGRYGNMLDTMGFTQGDMNPQNRMQPMQSLPYQSAQLDTKTLSF